MSGNPDEEEPFFFGGGVVAQVKMTISAQMK